MERNNRFLKLLRYDLRNSFYQNRFRIFGAAGLFLFLVCMMEQYFEQMQVQIGIEGLYCYLLYGNRPYTGSDSSQFELPVIWFLFHGYLLFLIGDYPWKDLRGYGEQVFLKAADRKKWWLEKCIWIFLMCCFYMVLFLLAGTIYLTAIGKPIRMPFCHISEVLGIQDSVPWIVSALVLHLLTLVCICVLQLVLSIKWNCLPAFAVILILLVGSAYTDFPILPGNAMMLARTCGKQMIRLSQWRNYLLAVCYFSILCLAGYSLIKRYEIKGRK